MPSSGFCGVAAAALSLRIWSLRVWLRIWSWLEVVAPKSWLGHAWWVRARKCVAVAPGSTLFAGLAQLPTRVQKVAA
eukprot:scaffold3428_cov26-Phaeocystis_antarctica.AAC.1